MSNKYKSNVSKDQALLFDRTLDGDILHQKSSIDLDILKNIEFDVLDRESITKRYTKELKDA
jgi:hypothetical protein